jgi:hypothetical protein
MTNGTHISLARRSAIIQKNHDELKMCSYGNALSVKTLAYTAVLNISSQTDQPGRSNISSQTDPGD